MADNVEKSGVHLTGADSGWPVGDTATEPPHTKDGEGGEDTFPAAESVAEGAVKDAGKDEKQKVSVTGEPTGGTFTLTFDGKTTAAIAFDATAKAVREALEALSNIGSGNVEVSGEASGPYTVTFAGDLVDKDVAQLTGDGEELTGGTEPAVAVETTQAGEPL